VKNQLVPFFTTEKVVDTSLHIFKIKKVPLER